MTSKKENSKGKKAHESEEEQLEEKKEDSKTKDSESSEKESSNQENESSKDQSAEDELNEDQTTDEEAKKDQETFESKFLRMTADFQNFKRRVDKEKSDIHAFANEKFAKDLLEVLDNFERAIEHDKTENVDQQYVKGMEMILSQLQEVLKKNGVEEIEALGEEFDPNFHHAVAMESSDKHEKGSVIDVMQKGYKIKDRVIRPAMVRVAE